MSEEKKETIKNRGCPCGWPLDPCNPKFKRSPAATDEDCAKVKGPADREGRIAVSKDGVVELLGFGAEALDELERLRKVLGPDRIDKVEVLVDGMKDE